MRTTVDIDDGVLAAARAIAATEKRSLGAVLSDLARRALQPDPTSSGDFPVFDVAEDAPPLTPELVRRALEE